MQHICGVPHRTTHGMAYAQLQVHGSRLPQCLRCVCCCSPCSQVGDAGEWGLSIEQRKRLTIAVELVANPSVVFMDEPTSGLDARAAAIVMRAVRNTVNTGRTVVCTIHQPSIDIIDVSAASLPSIGSLGLV